jgi:hypothetical protein
MLEPPRLLLVRALDPSYPREPLDPPPKASLFPPPPRETSRLPIRSAPPPPVRFPAPTPPPALLLTPAPSPVRPPPGRLLARLPPCRPSCCRALVCRLARESPRVVPPNLSAVARSLYGAPPRCCGLCFQLDCPRFPPPMLPRSPPPAGSCEGRLPPRFELPPAGSCEGRLPPTFELRMKLLLLLMLMLLLPQPQPQPPPHQAPMAIPTPNEIASPAA